MKQKFEAVLLAVKLFLVKTFSKSFDFFKENSHVAVRVTNVIKNIVESPATHFIVDLTKTQVDNQLLAKLRPIVVQVADKAMIAHNIYQTAKNNNEAVKALTDYIRTLGLEGRAKFYVDFCAEVNIALADGDLSYPESVALTQMIFSEYYQGK